MHTKPIFAGFCCAFFFFFIYFSLVAGTLRSTLV